MIIASMKFSQIHLHVATCQEYDRIFWKATIALLTLNDQVASSRHRKGTYLPQMPEFY